VNAKEVTKTDFDKALEKIGPSISEDMENWYKNFAKQVRRIKKPATPIA
jgi:SpoVK/Ycf46/Vps4 family AAA+-type ATPase